MNKKPRGRRPLSADEMENGRAAIVKAARALFGEHGYSSVSMRALAAAIDMSPTSLYRFYPNKRAILVQIWAEIFSNLFCSCRKVASGADTPVEALTGYAVRFVEYWVNNPENYMMVYGEIDTPQKGESFFADNDLVAEELSYLGELLMKAGVEDQDIDLTLQQLLCAMHGVCHSLVTIPEMNWNDAKVITTGLVTGVLKSKWLPDA